MSIQNNLITFLILIYSYSERIQFKFSIFWIYGIRINLPVDYLNNLSIKEKFLTNRSPTKKCKFPTFSLLERLTRSIVYFFYS